MATFQPSGGGAAAVAAGTASQSAVAASAAGPSEAGPLGGYSMASASGLRMDPFGDVGIFAEDLGLGNMIDLEAFGGSMVQPAVAAAPPAGAPLPQQAGGSTATAAIVTHELWPTLVELNVAIAELSAPAAGEMGQHNALRHALNNVSARCVQLGGTHGVTQGGYACAAVRTARTMGGHAPAYVSSSGTVSDFEGVASGGGATGGPCKPNICKSRFTFPVSHQPFHLPF